MLLQSKPLDDTSFVPGTEVSFFLHLGILGLLVMLMRILLAFCYMKMIKTLFVSSRVVPDTLSLLVAVLLPEPQNFKLKLPCPLWAGR